MADLSPLSPPVLPDWFKGTAFADDSSGDLSTGIG